MARAAAAEHAASVKAVYRRHRPEETVLYRTLERYWPEFRERTEEAGGLPAFVVREVEAFLRCGRLEEGCLHLVCERCGHSRLVAFSCQTVTPLSTLDEPCPECRDEFGYDSSRVAASRAMAWI